MYHAKRRWRKIGKTCGRSCSDNGVASAEVERRLSVIEELDATVEANLTRTDHLRQAVLLEAFNRRLGKVTSSPATQW
ncbi:MAG: hypothetical protein NTAFB01_30520 [Nitrospira sp.]